MSRHPVEVLLREHAYAGSEPTSEEIDDLQLTVAGRRLVKNAAAEAKRLRSDGEQGRAHRYALETSREIVAGLPEAQRDPKYAGPPDPLADVTDPAKLAASVPR